MFNPRFKSVKKEVVLTCCWMDREREGGWAGVLGWAGGHLKEEAAAVKRQINVK